MQDIDLYLVGEETFVGEYCEFFDIDFENKQLHLIMSGGLLYDNPSTRLSKAELLISNWKSLKVKKRTYNHRENIDFRYRKINEIFRIEFNNIVRNDILILVDMEYDVWIDWMFCNPDIIVRGEIEI